MKKAISVLMVLLLLLPFCMTVHAGDLPPIPLTTKSTRVAGDADGDGNVDLRDVTAIVRYLAGGWGVTVNEKNADVNGDNIVNLKDAVLLRRYFAGGWNVTLQ